MAAVRQRPAATEGPEVVVDCSATRARCVGGRCAGAPPHLDARRQVRCPRRGQCRGSGRDTCGVVACFAGRTSSGS